MKSYWNYRILAQEYPQVGITFFVAEVYYENNIPTGYDEINNDVHERVPDVETAFRMKLIACRKDVLWSGDKFPQVYKKK